MKNLVLLGERRNVVAVHKDDDNDNEDWISDIAYDPNVSQEDHYDNFGGDNDNLTVSTFVLTPKGTLLGLSGNNNVTVWECDLNVVCEDVSSTKDWFRVTFVEDLDGLVCLSHSGAIVTVTPHDGTPSLIGEFENGLLAGCWSPDYDILALFTQNTSDDDDITSAPVLMTMNAQFEILAEVTLDPFMEGEGVEFGWRPSGVSLAVSTVDAEDVTRRIRVYSREALELEAIGRSEDGSGKVVPNLQRNLAWATGGCSHALATVQKRGKRKHAKESIVFFEPNGLRHRDFQLRPSAEQETVTNLAWNSSSDLLAVVLHCTSPSSSEDTPPVSYGKLQLWHRSNYHWYLKYEFQYDKDIPSTVSCIQFHEEKPYHLTVALRSGRRLEWRTYEWQWDWSVVSPKTGTATIIDGNCINVTPLSKAMVPPPMYAAQMVCPANVCHITHAPSHCQLERDAFVAQLSNDTLWLGGDPTLIPSTEPTQSTMIANYTSPQSFGNPIDISEMSQSYSLRQIHIVHVTPSNDEDYGMKWKLIAIGSHKNEQHSDSFIEMVVNLQSNENQIQWWNAIPLDQRVLRVANWSDDTLVGTGGAFIEFIDGSFVEYESSLGMEAGNIHPSLMDPMLEPCPWISAIYRPIPNTISAEESMEDHHDQQRLVMGLSERSRLYCGERLLSNACSSFVIAIKHGFVCHVTLGSRCQMLFVPLTVLATFDPLMGSDDNMELLAKGYEPRSVERGAQVVAVLPHQPTAILQLPRGNLEGIYPRALVLPYAMKLIRNQQFGPALDIMRKQKVDLNLMVDMNPYHFLQNNGAEQLLAQVPHMDYLNLFISCLVNEDSTLWKFPIPDWSPELKKEDSPEKQLFDFTEKVNKVCQKMRSAMIEAESNRQVPMSHVEIKEGHFLLPILSTFAKEHPPQLEAALDLIRTNAMAASSTSKNSSSSSSKKSPLLGEEAQSSIQYLAFLADYELLFHTALGMYDYDLAKAVARNSQMDPKVYLPLLKKLMALPEYMGKYEVDVKLKRYESALTHLIHYRDQTTGEVEFATCLSFIKQHKLYEHGLTLFGNGDQPAEHRSIMVALAEHLVDEGKNDVALALFLAVEPKDYKGAKKAARRCGDWNTYFALSMEERPVGNEVDTKEEQRKLRATAYEIAEEVSRDGAMKTREGCKAASTILLDYCDDCEEAIDMLMAGQWWFESRRIALLHNRGDILKRIVDSAVSYSSTLVSDLETRIETFQETNDRYAVVLNIRQTAGDDGNNNLDGNNPDDSASLFTVASNASASSLRSNMSASSVGSVHSVSSVISAGAVSTFSITGEIDAYKHKSKYNTIGKNKKKKKKKTKRERKQRIKPGSQEELQSLVSKLKETIVSDELLNVIVETIRFLAQIGGKTTNHHARDLYESYQRLLESIQTSQESRISKSQTEKELAIAMARKEGQNLDTIVLDCEKEVDDLRCKEFPPFLKNIFLYF